MVPTQEMNPAAAVNVVSLFWFLSFNSSTVMNDERCLSSCQTQIPRNRGQDKTNTCVCVCVCVCVWYQPRLLFRHMAERGNSSSELNKLVSCLGGNQFSYCEYFRCVVAICSAFLFLHVLYEFVACVVGLCFLCLQAFLEATTCCRTNACVFCICK